MKEPGAPTTVALLPTSDTMLTVSFDDPTDNGGDSTKEFVVAWDTSPNLNSLSPYPDKGEVRVSAARHRSVTLTSLKPGRRYYARVSAVNSVGTGMAQHATTSRAATKHVPGKPHGIQVASGFEVGTIDVAWQRPLIPHHGVPCSGTLEVPEDCPAPIGGSVPASDGGSTISQYEVEFNEDPDFTGQDGGHVTTVDETLVLGGLTPGRMYFIRVLARNSVGSGSFCSNAGNQCLEASPALSAPSAFGLI